ncbi:hypothetical protein B0H34DRAFT_678409 [Crassisporium funariophilum]|nr:hypothetical protein B0H34DRAFT_678409 [Crassisporium funariophilum]
MPQDSSSKGTRKPASKWSDEDVSRFESLFAATKRSTAGQDHYLRLHPICSNCVCGPCDIGNDRQQLRCLQCIEKRMACQRQINFWVTQIAQKMSKTFSFVMEMYLSYGKTKKSSRLRRVTEPSTHADYDTKGTPESDEAEGTLESDEEEGTTESDEEGYEQSCSTSDDARSYRPRSESLDSESERSQNNHIRTSEAQKEVEWQGEAEALIESAAKSFQSLLNIEKQLQASTFAVAVHKRAREDAEEMLEVAKVLAANSSKEGSQGRSESVRSTKEVQFQTETPRELDDFSDTFENVQGAATFRRSIWEQYGGPLTAGNGAGHIAKRQRLGD